jgi:Na+-transporting methylmalonyl-CoA/oxaloacetate decarboxylase beta subunit
MKKWKTKIVLFIILGIALLCGTIFVSNVLFNNNKQIVSSIKIIGGADGPTTIYIYPQFDWRLCLIFSLFAIALNLIILTIINIIEHINIKTMRIIFKIIIIFMVNFLLSIILFPSMVLLSVFLTIMIVIAIIIKNKLTKEQI